MISVLNTPFYDKDIEMAVEELLLGIETGTSKGRNLCISATGAHGLIEAKKNPDFDRVLQECYINLPDGMPVVWVGRMKGAKRMQRCYGPAFFESLIKATADLPVNHFFCGGKEGVAEDLKTTVSKKFGNYRVSGVYSPPFRDMTEGEMRELGQRITNSGAHIVWIGISTPRQEKFARRLAKFAQTHYIITVGAAFDFHTGRVKQAPRWVQNVGMEWFFRLLMEPKRLFGRYSEIVPKFIWLNIKEFMDFYVFKKKHI